MAVERLVDVRDLEPPRPLETVLAAAQTLCPGEYLAMLHRREPVPLYPLLADLSLCHRTIAADGQVRVLIWRRDDDDAARHCGPADPVPPDAPEPCR